MRSALPIAFLLRDEPSIGAAIRADHALCLIGPRMQLVLAIDEIPIHSRTIPMIEQVRGLDYRQLHAIRPKESDSFAFRPADAGIYDPILAAFRKSFATACDAA